MQQPPYFSSPQSKPLTMNDLAVFSGNIENLIDQLHRNIEIQLQELRTLLNQDRGHIPSSVGGAGKNSIVLSAVPPTTPNSQQPTLLFTPETKQVFQRTALSRELFELLKRVSKRWLANVPEDQRRQATKVAQAIAKAVTEGRVSLISSKDLENYKARIRQALHQNFDIPSEQICAALSQKIRVYLQNTKSKHDKWVERYGGQLNINAPHIHIPHDKSDDEDDMDDSLSTKVKTEDANLLLPSVGDSEMIDSLIGKRSSDSQGFEQSASKLRKEESTLINVSITQYEVQELKAKADSLSYETFNEIDNTTTTPGRDTTSQVEYKRKVILMSLFIGAPEKFITRKYHSPGFLQSAHGIFIDYCVDKAVFNVTLDEMQELFVKTFVRMLTLTVDSNKPIDNVTEALKNQTDNMDPKSLVQYIEHNFTLLIDRETVILSGFCDFGKAFNFEVSEDILPSNSHASMIDYWFSLLQITTYPDTSSDTIPKLIILLMITRGNVDLSSITATGLSGLRNLSDEILTDMLGTGSFLQTHLVTEPLYA